MDNELRDDILKPASTRSKIVVNLIEPRDPMNKGQIRAFYSTDEVNYELDPYDKVRMRLLRSNEEFYKAYQAMTDEIRRNPQLQPKKKRVNFCLQFFYFLVQYIVLAIVAFTFLTQQAFHRNPAVIQNNRRGIGTMLTHFLL